MTSHTADTTLPARRTWFGHPAPLAWLFAVEMWERFGFYGMRALLIIYLTKHFVLGDHVSAGVYGGYTSLVYLTPLIGGWVADQFIGARRAARFGALFMAVGYLALAASDRAPAQPWAAFDGARHPITISHFHDGPTSAADEARQVTIDGRPLTIHGLSDGRVELRDAQGTVTRVLPAGAMTEGSDRDPVTVAVLILALSTIAMGNGFFKPCISTMVGALYAQGDKRRDAGFTIFYMGINLGSILGQMIAPVLADTLGWWAGFGITAVVMLLAFALLTLHGGRLDGLGDTPPHATRDRGWLIYALAVAAVPLVYLLFLNVMAAPEPAPGSGFVGYLASLPLMGRLLVGTFALGVPAILAWAWRAGSRAEFQMMLAAMVLITFNTVFWSLFEQAGSSLTLFADRNTDRSVFGLFTLSAPQVQNFNSLSIVTLAPVMGALWAWLAKRDREPSIPVKFGLALVGVGAGFLLLVLGAQFAGPEAQVGLGWLAGLYVIHSIAELCISPVGLSMITKLSIARVVGLMMGMWFLSMSMGEYVAGMLAQIASVQTVGGAVTDAKLSLATYVDVFSHIGWAAMAIGVVLLALARPIRRLMHGVS